MNLTVLLSFLFLITTCQFCDSAKILAIVPFHSKSHHNFIRPIIYELSSRGHEVTFYTSIPLPKNVKNIKEIVIKDPMANSTFGTPNFESLRKIGEVPVFGPCPLWFFGIGVMNEIMKDPDIQKLILSNEKYDLVLIETHFFQEALVAFGHKFQAPVVSLHTFMTYFYTDEFIGNPFGVAYLPGIEVPYTDQMTFIQRTHNTLRTWILLLGTYTFYLPAQENFIRKYFTYEGGEKIPALVDMLQNVSLILTNSHLSVDYSRPLVPNVVGVAGLHISPKRQPLPQDLQKFMDDSKNGVIYFSFGSVVPSEDIPDDMKNSFIKAFGKLKQNVIWKLPVKEFPELPKNVKLGSWFPQQDILAHPNCVAFITHGGLLSQIEAVYFEVPLVGIPFFGEQQQNVNRAAQRGIGIFLDQFNITEESVSWAINEILNKPSYRENMKKYSKIFNDNPLSPLDKAIYWIEYIIRYKGAPHLRSEGRTLPYYKYLLLDVIIFTVFIVFLILLIMFKVTKFILSFFCRSENSKPRVLSTKKKN